ncbi:DNA-methyltransferase [Exiguobacterium sp. CinTr1]|uniref:DNA-methyltransferase n=1 Tax=Exiguobacterium sp. CinTr1 TaxID=2995315 RepID=UPI0022E2707E|nr:site-specific DNA-methyltransferase [Exiguobacterium sp. CinTr1]
MDNGLDAVLNQVFNEDCLEGMRKLPNDSIDLVVIDPPYNIKKAVWDSWEDADEYISFMTDVFVECERVLKNNGSFYWFHNDLEQISRLMGAISKNTQLSYKQMLTIDKSDSSFVIDLYGSQNHFRNYINIAEYCLFYTIQQDTGLNVVRGDYRNFESIKKYFINEKKRIESDLGIKIKDHIKWTTHFHWFAQGLSWSFCSEQRYQELQTVFEGYFLRPYSSLKDEYSTLYRKYETQRYTFNYKDGVKNVMSYSFKVDKQLKHPTQKPTKLIESIVACSSNPGDVVLDCFMGSGTTAIACINTGRNYIGFELDETYHTMLTERIKTHIKQITEVSG